MLPIRESLIKYVFEPNAAKVSRRHAQLACRHFSLSGLHSIAVDVSVSSKERRSLALVLLKTPFWSCRGFQLPTRSVCLLPALAEGRGPRRREGHAWPVT